MEISAVEYSVADRDFYAPLASAALPEDRYQPRQVAPGWRADQAGVWTMWHRGDLLGGVEDGWKVHVSARPDRLREVLDAVSGVCFEHGTPFKHLTAPLFHWWSNYKYAARPQSGKFIAAYPADVPAARRLMESLRDALADEDGPYILSDRRFRDSRTVHYRYGAFVPRERVQADGTRVLLVRDGHGRLIPDRRGVSFRLPPGVEDPFAEPAHAGAGASASLGGYLVDGAIRHSNAGGAYRAHHAVSGREVFIKEARPHTGLREDYATAPELLRAEWETLTALQALAPGLVPEPIAYFREWEHEFLVTELVEGVPLGRWVAAHHPALIPGSAADDFARYYARCEAILSAVESDLARMRELGYLFVDVSPGNVLVGPADAARLVDFGAAHRIGEPFTLTGTPGYCPPAALVGGDLAVYDDYGVSALAQLLLGPLHQVVEREPGALRHLHHDLREPAPIPPGLWARVTRFHQAGGDRPRQMPTPEEVADDPVRFLGDLRDAVADALAAMADLGNPERVFPTVVQGYRTNTVCVAYGTAGVAHAMRQAGRPLPEGLADRLRRDALEAAGKLSPGLYVGLSGVAWVLADLGLLSEAEHLLAAADRHPLTGECATLYGGSAGVALAHLALYGHTGDESHIDRAQALAAALPGEGGLAPLLGPRDATGLMHGRCGVALMLQQLAGVTGDARPLAAGVRLLHAELDRAVDPAAPGLLFPVSATDRRRMPYLFCGSAGLALTVTRYLRVLDDERLALALPRLLAPVRGLYAVMPGLCLGLAGFAFTLADHARLTGDEASRAAALRAARGLFKYAVPHPTGVRYLGNQMMRYSAELWSGSAGVLLALTGVLSPRPDLLFTVDAQVAAVATANRGERAAEAPRAATVP